MSRISGFWPFFFCLDRSQSKLPFNSYLGTKIFRSSKSISTENRIKLLFTVVRRQMCITVWTSINESGKCPKSLFIWFPPLCCFRFHRMWIICPWWWCSRFNTFSKGMHEKKKKKKNKLQTITILMSFSYAIWKMRAYRWNLEAALHRVDVRVYFTTVSRSHFIKIRAFVQCWALKNILTVIFRWARARARQRTQPTEE